VGPAADRVQSPTSGYFLSRRSQLKMCQGQAAARSEGGEGPPGLRHVIALLTTRQHSVIAAHCNMMCRATMALHGAAVAL